MDTAHIYSLRPGNPPNESMYFRCAKALLSTSPILHGAAVGAAIGYFQGQSVELATAGALAGAVTVLPTAAYAATLASIPYYVQHVERIAPNAANNQFRNRVAELESWVRDASKLSDRVKHVTLVALGITTAYYCIPDKWVQDGIGSLPKSLTNLPSILKNYADTPAIEPGLEELSKTALNAGLFLADVATSLTRIAAKPFGFRNFQKFVASSALVFSTFKSAEYIGSFRIMQPITKQVLEIIKQPAPFYELVLAIGSAVGLHSFGTYLQTLPVSTQEGNRANTLKDVFSNWKTLFPQDLSKVPSTFSERLSEYWNPTDNTVPLTKQLSNWWDETFMKLLVKSSSFAKLGPDTSETVSAEEVSSPSLLSNINTYAKNSIPTILKQGALPLLAGAILVHVVYRYYNPAQKAQNPNVRRAATVEEVVAQLQQIKAGIEKPVKTLLDYFPYLKRNTIEPLYRRLDAAVRDNNIPEMNTLHALIIQNLNTKISELSTAIANNANPAKKFETAFHLIQALELKLQELEYRMELAIDPATNIPNRRSIVQIAQGHALQAIVNLYKEQITLMRELKNDLENISAPKTHIDTVMAFLVNLDKEKAAADFRYKEKLADLSRAFPLIKDWDKTLSRFLDGNLEIFEPHTSSYVDSAIETLQSFNPFADPRDRLTNSAVDWIDTLPDNVADSFIKDPMKTLPKLTLAQRDALRLRDADDLASLGIQKTNIRPQMFPLVRGVRVAPGPNADEQQEIANLMCPV